MYVYIYIYVMDQMDQIQRDVGNLRISQEWNCWNWWESSYQCSELLELLGGWYVLDGIAKHQLRLSDLPGSPERRKVTGILSSGFSWIVQKESQNSQKRWDCEIYPDWIVRTFLITGGLCEWKENPGRSLIPRNARFQHDSGTFERVNHCLGQFHHTPHFP